MNIDRHNYEEYFILYLDNELSEENRQAVEAFAQAHPDLQEELDLLHQTTFTPESHIVFEHKDDLLAISNPMLITESNYEEWLLLYIDNELSQEQQAAVEHFIQQYPAAQQSLALLRQTKLPAETIVFAGKEVLFRKEEKTKPSGWWKIAAAAAVFFAIGTTAFFALNNNNATAVDPAAGQVAANAPKNNTAKQPTGTSVDATPDTAPATTVGQPSISVSAKQAVTKKTSTDLASGNSVTSPSNNPNNLPEPDQNPYYKDGITGNSSNALASLNTTTDLTGSPETRNHLPVTKDAATASLLTTHPDPIDEMDADEPDGKKNKLRGFFRKVTRTFEKRTNIETTSDDDRLLVGGLAIKLK